MIRFTTGHRIAHLRDLHARFKDDYKLPRVLDLVFRERLLVSKEKEEE